MKFKRILLKLSGESLMGAQGHGIDTQRLNEYADQIREIREMGVQVGIVIGGGNIFRGLSGAGKGFDRVKGDQMGMCATVINSLALSSALGAQGVPTRVLTAIRMEPIGEFYSKWKALEALERGEVVIMSAGTGNPYFTTDTGSSLRGIEIEADVMLKGTRVDGVYTADPEKDPTATKFDEITYDEVLRRGLKVMDVTATAMCRENHFPIYVFNFAFTSSPNADKPLVHCELRVKASHFPVHPLRSKKHHSTDCNTTDCPIGEGEHSLYVHTQHSQTQSLNGVGEEVKAKIENRLCTRTRA